MLHVEEPFASVAVVLFGLLLGSFLNVCIYRLPLGKSVVWPGSHCRSCGSPVRWYQNLPVLSWLALRGRCARCAARISLRYPVVEALSAGMLLAFWKVYGGGTAFVIASIFGLSLLVLFFTDYDHQLLPDLITLPGIAVGLAMAPFNPFLGEGSLHRLWIAGTGAVLGSGLLWSIGAVYSRLRGVEAMGLGDVKMMGMVGAFSGPLGVLCTLFAASCVGAIVGLALIPLRGKSLADALPFGCFLAPAALAALLVGRQVVTGYFDYVGMLRGSP